MSAGAPAVGAVVIGVGNPLRGDDGAGPEVARRVRARAGGSVRVLELDGEPSRLIEAWEGAGLAVVVDASSSGAEAGALRRFDAVAEPLPAGLGAPSTHALGVADAVELARALDRLPERLVVYGIEGGCFGSGEGLSPAVEDAVALAAERVVAEVAN